MKKPIARRTTHNEQKDMWPSRTTPTNAPRTQEPCIIQLRHAHLNDSTHLFWPDDSSCAEIPVLLAHIIALRILGVFGSLSAIEGHKAGLRPHTDQRLLVSNHIRTDRAFFSRTTNPSSTLSDMVHEGWRGYMVGTEYIPSIPQD